MNIGDLYLALRGDGTMLQKDVTKAGDAAGKTFGQKFGLQLGAGIRSAVGAGAGLALGAAITGANELDAATRQLQADAGLTADEAKAASHAIAGLYQDNLQGIGDIGGALSKVITDLGLTGDAATEATEAFLKFSTATGQDAADAVAAIDDVLDAFNLSAEDSQAVLDVLVKSHQEYGGSIEESEAALAKLAPALTAANLSFEDGAGLLNLFNAAGVDASKASAALAKALTKVESPEELQQLIADISATEDPFERARKATELFGSRAGPQLAQALAQGNLEDYVITMGEAAGATDEAAAAVESGWGARFTKLMHTAGGALAEFGTKFGPLLMVASAFGPQLTRTITAGLGGLVGLAGPAIARAGKALGARLMAALGAEVLASRIIGDALTGLPLTSGPAATTAGTKLGGLLSKGMAIGLVLGIAALADIIEPELEKVGNKVGMSIWKGILGPENVPDVRGWLASLPWPFGPKDTPDISVGPFEHLLGGSSDPEWRAAGESAGDAFVEGTGAALTPEKFAARTAGVEAAAGRLPAAVAGELSAGGGAVDAAAQDMVDGIPDEVDDAKDEAKAVAGEIPGSIADGIEAKRDVVTSAFDSLKTALKNELSPAKEMARTIGFLTSQALADGLKSKDPVVRARAQQLREIAENRLSELRADGTKVGKAAGENLAKGLKSKNPRVRAEAQRIKQMMATPLQSLPPVAKTYGANTTQAYANGIRSRIIAVRNAAIAVSKAAQTIWRAKSPPGPESPLHDIDKWGANTVQAWVDGMLDQQRTVTRAAQTVSGAAAAPLASPFTSGAMQATPAVPGALGAASVANGGDVYNINVPIDGLIKAGNPLEVAGQLRRLADLGVLAPKKPVYR